MAATTPEAAAARATPAWRLKLERFWRWWSGELLALVPQRFAALAGGARVPLLALEEGGVALLEPRVEGKAAERVDLSGLEPARAASAVRVLLEGAGEARGRARLALLPHEALVRRVTMPAATEENLAAVLAFEMDRLTPFRDEEVYPDHRIVARDAAAGTITLVLAAARREIVEARLAQARGLGLSGQGVAVREDPPRGGPALDVLPSVERGERDKPRERLAKQLLAGAALVLLLAALAVPALRKRSEVLAIRPALDRAYADAQATEALIRDLERQVADYNFLLARKHGTHPALALVEEVSRLLPDNTWLQQMEIKGAGKGREVVISGETISSSKLIEILEQSRLLQNAAPRGTVTRGTQPGTERFVIAAEARPRPQPEAVPVTQARAPVTATPGFAPPQAAPAAPAPAPAQPAAPATATLTPQPPQQDIIFKPRGKIAPPPPEAPKGPTK